MQRATGADPVQLARIESRLPYLDALRGLAATVVLAAHVGTIGQFPEAKAVEGFTKHGVWGVQLFFVVSAFSLMMMADRRAGEAWPNMSFAIRRFCRIAPLFYVMAVIIWAWNPWKLDYSWGEIASNALFVFNFPEGRIQWGIPPAGWTIGVEMPFYVLFPLLVLRARDALSATLLVVAALVISSLGWLAVERLAADPANYWRFSIFAHLPTFAWGIAAYRWLPVIKASRFANQLAVLLLLAFLLLGYLVVSGSPLLLGYHHAVSGAAFASLLMGLAILPLRLLVNAFTAWLGVLSYSIYLLHVVMIRLASDFGVMKGLRMFLPGGYNLLLGIVVIGAATVLAAFFSMRIIEGPGNALAHYWVAKLQRRPVKSIQLTRYRPSDSAVFLVLLVSTAAATAYFGTPKILGVGLAVIVVTYMAMDESRRRRQLSNAGPGFDLEETRRVGP